MRVTAVAKKTFRLYIHMRLLIVTCYVLEALSNRNTLNPNMLLCSYSIGFYMVYMLCQTTSTLFLNVLKVKQSCIKQVML